MEMHEIFMVLSLILLGIIAWNIKEGFKIIQEEMERMNAYLKKDNDKK